MSLWLINWLQLNIPQRPILSVVEGAAYFGITPIYVKAKILKYTYGEMLAQSEKCISNYFKGFHKGKYNMD